MPRIEHLGSTARLYTLGPEGTFSDKAAQRLKVLLTSTGSAPPEVVYTRTIPEVVARAEADPDSLGVFPIENSDTGTVLFAQDALVRHRVAILLEINIRVRFSLLANAPPGEVRRIFSQPVAADQCNFYMAEHMPQAVLEFTRSNMESGHRFLAEEGEGPLAAIVPFEFGEEHPTWRTGVDIQNYPENTTRFLVVRERGAAGDPDPTLGKTSLWVEPREDRPGLLYDLLSVFNRHRLNLCRLESRPAKVRPWTYVFFIDFNNNEGTPDCLAELERGDHTLNVLGSFDTLEDDEGKALVEGP